MHLAHGRNSRLIARRARTSGWLIAGLALLASCAAFTLNTSTDAPYAALLRGCTESRAQPYLSCVSAAVLQYSYQHPRTAGAVLSYVFDHAPDRGRRADLRPLSETAHYAGMELSALHITLQQALDDCGYAFKAACMHGFVMEKLDHMQIRHKQLVRSFLGFCLPVESDEWLLPELPSRRRA